MQGNKIKIAMMWSNYVEGSSFNELARSLPSDRFELIFIFLKKRESDPETVDKNGHKVFYLSAEHRIHSFEFGILRKLVKILKEEQVDILHAHRHKPSVYAAAARLFTKIPVLLVHVHGITRTKNLRRKLQNIWLFRQFDRIIGCSKAVRDDVKKTNPWTDHNKIIALENSIDFEKYSKVLASKQQVREQQLTMVAEDAFVFGTIARFGPYKGHDVLVRAFEKVKQKVPNAEVVFAGAGSDKIIKQIQQQVKQAGLEDSVHFLGRRNDIPLILNGLDAFVLPSIGSEGMPLSMLEAMSAGLPCISTEVSGIPEVINSEDVGFVVAPRDSDALANAMIKIAHLPQDHKDKVIKNARNRVAEKFSHKVVGKKLQKFYEDQIIADN